MGGPGSGRRWQVPKRRAAESLERWDVREEARKWPLKPGESVSRGGRWCDGEWRPQWIMLSFTPCHFGGMRPWFDCPGCGRRVAVLYRSSSEWFCRNCLGLTYRSSQESRVDRAFRQAHKLRRRLDDGASLLPPTPLRPPRMHWRTYWRLRLRLAEAVNEALLRGAASIGLTLHSRAPEGDGR